MKTKRLISLLMALMLVVTAMSGLAVTVAADEIDSTDPYVYSVQNYDFESDTGVSKWLGMATSPFYMDMKSNGESEVVLFELTDEANGNHPVETYCIDLVTGMESCVYYKRINLEDSAYFSSDEAQRIRTIVNNGVTVKQVADIQADANAWLEANGYAALTDLTGAEVLSATQAAIWCTANHVDSAAVGSYYVPKYTYIRASYYAGLKAYDENGDRIPNEVSAYTTKVGNIIAYNQAKGENSFQNVNNLVLYYLSLGASPAAEVAVSDKAIRNVQVTYDDKNNATVTCEVVGLTLDDADLIISASSVGVVSEVQNVTRNGAYTFTLNNVSAKGDVKVEINGTQAVEDVFFFEAKGGRSVSQTLVGIDTCTVPVHAEASANGSDRVLTIYKTTAAGAPLANIVFKVYEIGTLDDYVNGRIPVGSKPTAEDVAKYTAEGKLVANLATDQYGIAYYITDHDAIYLVVEEPNDVITSTVDPFFVAVPAGESGNLDYTVDVYPKNTVIEEDIIIEKDVTEIDNDWSTYDVGQVHTWIIQSSIPAGMATGLKYEITDTLNYQLTYVGNVVVTVSEKTAKAGEDLLELVEGEDYILTVTPGTEVVNEVEEEITSFRVALTKTGMEKAAAAAGTEPEVRVCFDACIDEDAIMAAEIPNQAHISYENNVGVDFDKDSDIPVVITGAGQLLKVDASNHGKVLSGAAFNVYREATAEEIADVNVTTVRMEVPVTDADGNTTMVEKELVRVCFYDNAGMVGEKVTEVVSDENGRAVIHGLAYGTYYLVETAAPAGYNKLTAPVEMVIDAASHTDAEVVTIYNAAGFQLPSTGGEGTGMFMVVGVVIIAAAMMLIIVPKKKNA